MLNKVEVVMKDDDRPPDLHDESSGPFEREVRAAAEAGDREAQLDSP